MYLNTASNKKTNFTHTYHNDNVNVPPARRIACRWEALRAQVLLQWNRLTSREVDEAGPDRHRLGLLIQNKYGVAHELVENYLRNFERTLPL